MCLVFFLPARREASFAPALEGKAAAVFDALSAAEQRLQALGIAWFEVQGQHEADYEEWLRAEVQEAIDDPSPSVPHEEAMRRMRAAVRGE